MTEPIVELRGISKSFPGVQALTDVTFDVRPGEVHALVGENGAGKSTLIKIIAGVYEPNSGEIYLHGRPLRILNPRHAQELGIAAIYQESSLYNELSVAENIFMGHHPTTGQLGAVNWERMYRESEAVLARLGVAMDVRAKVGGLSTANRQRVEMAKALSHNARIMIMDEPTASLTQHDVEALFNAVRLLQQQGVGIIYISHRLEELYELADRVTVLRDGRLVSTKPVSEVTEGQLVSMMVGRSLDTLFPKEDIAAGEVVLRVKGLTRRGLVDHASFEVRTGEIVGLAGLVGAGRSELAQVLFGIHPAEEGAVEIAGKAARIRDPREAMTHGLAYVPEDRQRQGLVLPMKVRDNISMSVLETLTRFGFVDRERESNVAQSYVDRLQIRTPGLQQLAINLSGGNQQKIVVSKWLASKPKVLILDEPTRGIDVGAKAEIHRLMSQLAQQGLGILMISSELPEILGMSDRILVMRKNTIVAEFMRGQVTQEQIIAAAMGLAMPQGEQVERQ